MTMCIDWSDENWDSVLFAIQEGNCILMLGPDASVETVNGEAMPLTEILAKEIAGDEKIRREIDSWHVDPINLAQVAQCYYNIKERNALLPVVKRFYSKRQGQTNKLCQNLAALPFDFIITSNHDDMFCQALRTLPEPKEPIIESYDFKGSSEDITREWSPQNPLVYYLYGSIEKPNSLVVAEKDILEFLVAVVTKNPRLPDKVGSYLSDTNKSLLFLGFGFKHWYLRILFHVLKIQHKQNKSFALEKRIPGQVNEDTIFFFSRNEYKIQICNSDLNSFVLDLKNNYECSSPTSTLPQAAPVVFICHANEDSDYAKQLYERLVEKGLRPWIDKEMIRGGDHWEPLIEDVINKETNYFIVLQSQIFKEKTFKESYINKEICFALERCKGFSPKKRKFIFPVQTDDVVTISELNDIQVFDIRTDTGFNALVTEIKRDFERQRGAR